MPNNDLRKYLKFSLRTTILDERFHLLQDKPKYVVSRNEQSGDLILAGDSSISRLHAFLYPTKSHVKVIDSGSKYGVYINDNIHTDIEIPKNQPAELYAGDQIRFGRLKNLWRLEAVQIVSLTSTLSATDKVDLVKDLTVLNGTCLSDWDSTCNYITVSNILITIKVLHALSAAIPIVKPSYWRAYITAIRNKSTPPTPDAFLPPIEEPYLPADVSFLPNINRKRLFAGKTFVFMIRGHKDKFHEVIKLAGGIAVSLDDSKIRKRALISATNIVIQYNPSTQSQTTQDINDICEYIRSSGLRAIPDSEIGLAIVHCSIAKFCNPKFKLDADFVTVSPQVISPSTSKILAANTPSEELFKVPMNIEVAETDESEKQVRSIRNASAKNDVPSATFEVQIRSNSKRRAPETIDEAQPPKKKNTISSIADKENLDFNTKSSNKPSQSVEQPISLDCIEIDDEDDELLASFEYVEPVQIPVSQPNVILPKPDIILSSPNHDQMQPDSFGYISTNRTRKTATTTPTNISTPTANRKRIHNLLNADGSSGDESDDNLFKFEKAPVAAKKTKTSENNAVQPPEENGAIFMFSTQPSSQQVPPKKQTVKQSTTVSSSASRMDTNTFDVSYIKRIPITMDGWLSKNTVKQDIVVIKTELNTTNGAAELIKSEENKAWINSLQNVFVSKFKQMNLINRTVIQSDVTAGGSNANNVKNFKAFVKVSFNFKLPKVLHNMLIILFILL